MPYPDITKELASIASRYQFHKPPDSVVRLQEFLRQLLQWLLEWLDSFSIKVPGVADSRPLSLTMTIVVYGAGAVALIILGCVIWKRLKRNAQNEESIKKGTVAIEKILDSNGLKEEAARYAKANNFKAACRSLYLSLLQNLHEREIAIFAPAKTNYEYCYLLTSHTNLQTGFKKLAHRVELVWFGSKDADEADYDYCNVLVEGMAPEIQAVYERKIAAQQAALREVI
jgi:hypothetical protein